MNNKNINRFKIAKILKENRGFTLLELMVTLVILGILIAVSVSGIAAYQRWSVWQKQENYAKTLYTAAQSALTQYSVSGQLEDISKELEKNPSNCISSNNTMRISLIGEDGQPVTADTIWTENTNKDKISGSLFYITGTKDDYQAYLSGSADSLHTVLYDIFSSYLYDKSVLNGAISVEFDPYEGLVYSVLYSDRADSLVYSDVSVKGTQINVQNRTRDNRREYEFGYYGVETLSKSTSVKKERPIISNVKLNNEETLNLTWNLTKVTDAIDKLDYDIILIDAKTNEQLLRINIDNTKTPEEDKNFKLAAEDAEDDMKLVTAQVTDLKTKDAKPVECSVLAYIDSDGFVHVILDAVDLNATEKAYDDYIIKDNNENKAILNTLSLHRFGLEKYNAEDIYCTVQGSGDEYKLTALKQSNIENMYYSDYEESEDGVSYEIANARHLYNIRYTEKYNSSKEQTISYLVTKSFAWGYDDELPVSESSILKNELVFEDGIPVTAISDDAVSEAALFSEDDSTENDKEKAPDYQAFPSITALGKTSSICSKQKVCSIDYLYLSDEVNNKYDAGKSETLYTGTDNTEGTAGTALFTDNSGKISKLEFSKLYSEGKDNTAGICAFNMGTLSELEIKDGTIKGQSNTAGFAAVQLSKTESSASSYTKLVNRAAVEGSSNVGGILGSIVIEEDNSNKAVIEECENYGVVQGTASDDKDAEYIGGIIGKADNNSESGSIEIKNCVSSMQYTDITDISELKLVGTYVGGIIGYGNNVSLTACSSINESSSKQGYVLGNKYVGGIAGFIEGDKSKIEGADGSIKNSGKNQAYVIGNRYAGGVIGINADIDANGELESTESSMTIENWINEGFVIALDSYAGGITGYNTGIIKNCENDVYYESLKLKVSAVEGGDYIGGIAGYNNGQITADKEIGIVSVVYGNRYTGGIVGYNDTESTISNYMLQGGYITGNVYTGGFAGFNASEDLLSSKIKSDPNQVNGKYMTGGVIGANILALTNDIETAFYTDNFLGSVSADNGMMVSGFIGYNAAVAENTDIEELSQNLAAVFFDNEELKEAKDQSSAEEILKAFEEKEESAFEYIANEHTLTVKEETTQGEAGNKGNVSYTKLGEISGSIYVGGVIGYCEENTKLTLKNIENKSPINASLAIDGAHAKTYAYAGGIIGKVSKNVIVDGCRNTEVGEVSAKGYYTGSIAEINYGTIQNCKADDSGKPSVSYIGGLAGINMEKAIIKDCALEGTIMGKDGVGGLVCDNYGTIENPSIKGKIIASGSEIGGIVSHSYSTGMIKFSEKEIVLDINISGNGTTVGGLAGCNEGEVVTEDGAAIKTAAGNYITGKEDVGGFFGKITFSEDTTGSKSISSYINYANVTAQQGYAGGITAQAEGKGSISKCENYGIVQVNKKNNDDKAAAGGITAVNPEGTAITDCKDYEVVKASKGTNAGICAENAGIIKNCTVDLSGKTMLGDYVIGGITGENLNTGTISGCTVTNTELTNQKNAKESYIGGITGINNGTIGTCTIGDSVKLYTSAAVPVYMGGIAGHNCEKAEITGTSTNYSTVNAQITLPANSTYFGDLGGIAGINEGTITNYKFSGLVQGTANNPLAAPAYNVNVDTETNVVYGIGGIAGVNGQYGKTTGTITNCKVEAAEICGIGDGKNIANVGGIAGVNAYGSTISKIDFGTGQNINVPVYFETGTVIDYKPNVVNNQNGKNTSVFVHTFKDGDANRSNKDGGYGHVGGVCGFNLGTIEYIGITGAKEDNLGNMENVTYISDYVNSQVVVTNYQGHTGGICGYDRTTGVIRYCATGKNWTVNQFSASEDNGTAGIAGYHNTKNGLSYCYNWANVKREQGNSVGGMIGRSETANTSYWRIDNCYNYGTIEASERSGGIVGTWKYAGGEIRNCINYGMILGSSNDSAGIVSMFYAPAGTMRIVSCQNHGLIKSNANAAGIAGITDRKAEKYTFKMDDCVNTGLIAGNNENNAGLLQNVGFDNAEITNCRNYGVAYGVSTNMFYGLKNGNLGTVSRFFGVADVDYPISNNSSSNISDSYYFYDNDNTNESFVAFGAQSITMGFEDTAKTGIIHNAGNVYQLVDGNLTNEENNPYFENPKMTEGVYPTYTFKFNGTINLTELDIYWYNNGNGRTFSYYVQVPKGRDWETIKKITSQDNQNNEQKICSNNIKLDTPYAVSAVRIVVTSAVEGSTQNTSVSMTQLGVKGYFNDQSNIYDSLTNCTYTVDGTDVKHESPGMLRAEKTFFANKMGVSIESVGTSKGVGKQLFVDKDKKVYDSQGKCLYTLEYNPRELLNSGTDSALEKMGAEKNNVRYAMFLADDKKITGTSVAIQPPDPAGGISYSNVGELATITWAVAKYASSYKYTIEYYNEDKLLKEESGTTSLSELTIAKTWNGTAVNKIKIKVTSVNINGDKAAETEKEIYLGETLATPVVRMELYDADKNQYRVMLENKDAYDESIYDSGELIYYYNGGKNDLKLSDVKSLRAFITQQTVNSINVNIKWIFQVINGSASSNQLRKESSIPGGTYLKTQEVYSTNNWQFKGTSMESLTYMMTFKPKDAAAYIRGAVSAVDNDLGVAVEVAGSSARTAMTGGADVTISISGIPADFFSAYSDWEAVSYPIYMSNNIVYFGHDVETDIKKSDLASIKVTDDGYTSENGELLIQSADGKKTLKEGYILRLQDNGLYTIYYTPLVKLENANWKTSQITPTFQDNPIISINDIKMTEKEETDVAIGADNQLTITWDSNTATDNNASYSYLVTGKTEDGAEVQLSSGSGYKPTANGNKKELSFDTSSWNYTSVTVKITREGTVDGNGVTTMFPSETTVTGKLKLRLPQIEKPVVGVSHDDAGIAMKNNLYYDISWEGYTEKSYTDALKEYRITIQGANKQITETVTDTSSCKLTRVDLSEFGRGETVSISVCAIAKEENAAYTDSIEGLVRELELPERLLPPDMSSNHLQLTPSYSENTGIEVSDFMEGITLTMNNGGESKYNKVSGKYEIVLKLYKNNPISDGSLTDKEPDMVLSDTDKPIRMEGNLNEGSFVIKNLSLEYAGAYVVAEMRATSDSAISSVWTDEYQFSNPDDPGISYAVLQLPAVKVAVPEVTAWLKDEQEEFAYDVYYPTTDENGKTVIKKTDTPAKVSQNTYRFKISDYAQAYEIVMNSLQKSESIGKTNYYYNDTVSFRIEKSDTESGYIIADYRSTSDNVSADKTVFCKKEESDSVIKYYYQLPYHIRAEKDIYYSDVYAWVVQTNTTNEDKTVTTEFSIAGVDGADIFSEGKYIADTANVTVQAIAQETNDPVRYYDSDIYSWHRANANAQAFTDIIEKQAEKPQDLTDHNRVLSVSAYKDYIYEMPFVQSDKSYLCEVTLHNNKSTDPNEKDTVIYVRVPWYTIATTNNKISQILMTEKAFAQYAKDAANNVSYSASFRICILDMSKGLSEWSDVIDTCELPEIQQTMTASKQDNDMSYVVNGNDGSEETIYYKEHCIEWDWSNSDEKTLGFIITMNPEGKEELKWEWNEELFNKKTEYKYSVLDKGSWSVVKEQETTTEEETTTEAETTSKEETSSAAETTTEGTTAAPETTTTAPETTTTAPETTTPAPETTTPAPETTTAAPETTTTAPETTTAAPQTMSLQPETTPAPETTTPAPEETAAETSTMETAKSVSYKIIRYNTELLAESADTASEGVTYTADIAAVLTVTATSQEKGYISYHFKLTIPYDVEFDTDTFGDNAPEAVSIPSVNIEKVLFDNTFIKNYKLFIQF